MLLTNDFVVDATVEDTWRILTDLERIAPCMPGASLDGRDGEDYLGSVKIKVGPISAHFHGTARFVEQDAQAQRATIQASGKDPKGQASASATIQARLEAQGDRRTRVLVDTDLDITGRMAQFGRGAIADVSSRLIKQFTDNLGRQVLSGQEGAPVPSPALAGPAAAPAPSPGPAAVSPEPGGLDVLSIMGPVIARRAAGPLIGLLVGLVLGHLLGRRSAR